MLKHQVHMSHGAATTAGVRFSAIQDALQHGSIGRLARSLNSSSVAQPAESMLMVRTWLQGLPICCCVSTMLLLLLAQAHFSAPPHTQSRSHFRQAITLPWQVLNGLLA